MVKQSDELSDPLKKIIKDGSILVTGGAGFLGSHLCKKLLQHSYKVICLDNLSTGQKSNIATCLQNPNFTYLEHDIVQPLPELGKIDLIFNLACPASPYHYQQDPIKTTKTSILGILNVLELARSHQAVIFQASTSEVYGDPLEHPQKESYYGYVNPIGPRACYDEGKRLAETLCFDYQRQYGVKIRVARIFNTYGPHMHPQDGRVVSNFITQALLNLPLTIYGDGSQTRSLCYVSDLIEGFIDFTAQDNLTGPINLGQDQEITVLELAKLILKLTGSHSSIVFHPLPQDDPKQRKPDLTLARQHLSWTPTKALNEGLICTIEYFDEVLKATPHQESLL